MTENDEQVLGARSMSHSSAMSHKNDETAEISKATHTPQNLNSSDSGEGGHNDVAVLSELEDQPDMDP